MKQRSLVYIAGIGVVLLCAIAFFPVSYTRIIREGTDRFDAHHALFGKRIKSITETAQSPLKSVGFVLVNLRHVDKDLSAHIRVLVDGRGEVAASDAVITSDDAFTWFDVPSDAVHAGERYTVEVSAPTVEQDTPVGLRFDRESKELALAVKERVSVWGYILRWKEAYPELAQKVFMTLFGGIVLTILLYVLELSLVVPKKFIWVGSLVLLFVCAIVIRIPLASSLDSAYGGDAFNYLLKSRALIDGEDPFAADFRKAPLYSLLAAPGLLPMFDAVTWERWVSMIAAAGTVVLIPLFLRRFTVPYSLAFAGGLLLAVNRDFQFESVQGLANTLYAFLVLLAAYMFLIGRSYLVAVFSALATLSRYEGAAVAAVLLPASWIVDRLKWKAVLRTLIPIMFLLAIPFVMSPFSHSLGVRTLSDIQSDDGLYIAYSFEDFGSNFKSFRAWFGRLWVLVEGIGKPFGWLVVGIGVVMLSKLLKRFSLEKIVPLIPYLLTVCFLAIVIRDSSEYTGYIVGLFAFLSGMGIAGAVGYNYKRSIPILLMTLVQIIAITAILPKTRYYLPIIPFLSLAIIGGIYFLIAGTYSRKKVVGALLFASILVSFVYVDARQSLSGQVSEYNEKSAGQTVLLSAARYMKHTSGIVAAADGSDLQFRTYLPKERVVIFPDSVRDVDTQYDMLKHSGVTFISDTTENPYFAKLVQEMPEKFQEVVVFSTKWSDISSRIYRVY